MISKIYKITKLVSSQKFRLYTHNLGKYIALARINVIYFDSFLYHGPQYIYSGLIFHFLHFVPFFPPTQKIPHFPTQCSLATHLGYI
jgi:hypothetical protein